MARVIPSLGRRWWLAPLLIYLAALSVRLVYLNQIEAMPTFAHPVMDERYHIQLAQQISGEQASQPEAFFRAPLYPYLLTLFYTITHHSFYWIRLLQILLSSLVPALIYLLFTRLHNRTIGFWSAFVLVWYPMSLHFDTSLLIESLMPLLLVALVWLLYRASDKLRSIDFIACGLALGITALTRPNILLLIPFLIFWIWIIIKPKLDVKRAIQRYILLIAACFIVILPVTIRNYVVSNDLVLIAWQGGVNFFIGNNRQANGWSATIPGVDQTWEGEYRETIMIPQMAERRTLKPSEISDYWYDAGWKEISVDKTGWVALLFKKFRILINGYETGNNQSEYMSRNYSGLLRMLVWNEPIYFPFGLFAPLAIIGLLISLSQWKKYLPIYLLLIAYSLSLVFFFVCARFRQPIIPFLIPFAVIGIYSIIQFLREKAWVKSVGWSAAFAVLALESNHNTLGLNANKVLAEEYTTLGSSYLEQNQIELATIYFQKTLTADPTFAQGYLNLGVLADRNHSLPEAEQNFRKAMQLAPGLTEAYINLATILKDEEKRSEALEVLQRAKAQFPLNDLVALQLGIALFESNQVDAGIAETERSLQLNPANTEAQNVLQQMRTYQSQIKK